VGSVDVLLPKRSKSVVELKERSSGVRVTVAQRNSRDVQGLVAEGYVIYPGAHESGASEVYAPLPDGFEDYLSFEQKPGTPSVGYELGLVEGALGLRLVDGVLEVLDANGAPRLRAAPPFIVGADGKVVPATLSVKGCAVDTSPAPPWNRALTPPGADHCLLEVAWHDADVKYPAVLDPRWSSTATTMLSARQEHTATLMTNGRVLVAGGRSGTATTGLASAELFDPATKTWSTAGSMTTGRRLHAAVQLPSSSNPTTSGKVLITGGIDGSTSLSTARLYDPVAGTWAAATSLSAARHQHTATVLASGGVLVAGGMSGTTVLNTASRFSQGTSGSGTWTAVGNLAGPRRAHSATLLVVPGNATLNNKVLVVGGNSGTASVTTVQLFDGTSTWSTLTALASAREGHTATAFSNGNVLVTGGKSGTTTLNTTLLFNAALGSGSFASAGNLVTARSAHTASLLPTAILSNGRVLVAGGSSGTATLSSTELWNGTNSWSTATAMPSAVQGHTANVLASGVVLVAGGVNGSTTRNAASVYDPSFSLACTSNSQCSTGFCVNGVCCDSACTDQTCNACNLAGKVGTCSPKPNGTSCNDSNACTQTDTCVNGTCTGANPIACAAPEQCHLPGTCNPATGTCSKPTAADGSTCSDGSACTRTDTCQGGLCFGSNPITCTATDDCHFAGCNAATGACTNYVKGDGSACSDGDVCTQSETCQAGSCVASTAYPAVLDVPAEDIGHIGGFAAYAEDINSRGDIVGYAPISSGLNHAFLWYRSPTMVDIGIEPGFPSESKASAINDAGTIAGSLKFPEGSHAFRYTSAGLEDLGLGGDGTTVTDTYGVDYSGSYAYDINDSGQLAGDLTNAGEFHGFRYTPGIGFEDIGSLGGNRTQATAIDASGRVVGNSKLPSSPDFGYQRLGHAVLFDDEHGLVDLNTYADSTLGFELVRASDIAGDFIVGGGMQQGSIRPFRLELSTGVLEAIPYRLGGSMYVTSVNRFGDMAGYGYTDPSDSSPYQTAFVYTEQLGFKRLNELIDPADGWNLELATAISDDREVVGWGTRQNQPRGFRLSLSSKVLSCGTATSLCGASRTVCMSGEGLLQDPDVVIVNTGGGTVSQTAGSAPLYTDHYTTDGEHVSAYFSLLPGEQLCRDQSFKVSDPNLTPHASVSPVAAPGMGPGGTYNPQTATPTQQQVNASGQTAAGNSPPPCSGDCGDVPDASSSEMPQSTAGVAPKNVDQNTALKKDASDPVNPMTGEFVYSNIDVEFPGVIPFQLKRTYRSRVSFHGPFGNGWDHSYNEWLVENPAKDELYYSPGNGTTKRFVMTQATMNQPQTTINYALPESDQTITLQRTVETDGSMRWVMTDLSSVIVREFRGQNGRGHLTTLSDANANSMTFNWEQGGPFYDFDGQPRQPRLLNVVDSEGRLIDFGYDDYGVLQRVTEDETGIGSSYAYYGYGDLANATDYVGHWETYTYDTPPSDLSDGNFVPQQGIGTACSTLCGQKTGVEGSPQNGGACESIVSSALATCSTNCGGCMTACNSGCNTTCNSRCSNDCNSQCSGLCNTQEMKDDRRDICQQLWDNGAEKNCSESACQDKCGATCDGYCGKFFFCIAGSTDEGATPEATAACQDFWGDLEGGLEDLGDLLALGWGAIEDGVICGLKKACFWCDDRECHATNIKEQWADLCNNDCFSCCTYGDECSPGSRNAGHECESDCGHLYFGDATYPGQCASALVNQCTSGCATGRPMNGGDSCVKGCQNGCKPGCTMACAAQCPGCADCSDTTFRAACESGCTSKCIANNNTASGGPKYGHKADLVSNLREIIDGNGRRTLLNEYGKTQSDPSFDAVVKQTLGDPADNYVIEYRYRDLSVATPAVSSTMDSYIVKQDKFESVYVCPPVPPFTQDQPGFLEAQRSVGGSDRPDALPAYSTVVRNFDGVYSTYYFNAKGQLIASVNNTNGARRSYEYDALGRQSGLEDALKGRECVLHEFTQSGLERITTFTYPVPTDDSPVPVRKRGVDVQWFPRRVVAEWEGEHEIVRSYGYQGDGALIEHVTQDNLTSTFVLDGRGLPDFMLDNDGIVTEFSYQGGQLSEFTTDARGSSQSAPRQTLKSYDNLGRLTSRTTPFGATETYTWTGKFLTHSERTGEGTVAATDYVYDADARISQAITEGLITHYEYDLLGMPRHVWTEPNPDGPYQLDATAVTNRCMLWAPGGRLLAEVQPEGNRLVYRYDEEGRLRSVSKGVEGQDSRTWDDPCAQNANGSLKAASGVILATQFDWNGRRVMVSTPDTGTTTARYNGYTEPAIVYDPHGLEVHTGYDNRGRVQWTASYSQSQGTLTRPSGVTNALVRATDYVYNGNLLEQKRRWNFDNERTGDATTDAFVDASRGPRDDVWEGSLRLGAHRYQHSVGGERTVFDTDGSGRVIRIDHANRAIETFQYFVSAGTQIVERRWTTSDGKPHVETQTYSAWGQPLFRLFTDEGVDVWETRKYDALGRLQNVSSSSGQMDEYVYDALGRLFLRKRFHSGSFVGSEMTVFDRNGAPTDSAVLVGTPAITHYDYDMLGRRWQETTADQRVTQRTYTDASNHPRTKTDPNGTSTYDYTPAGLVLSEQVKNRQGLYSNKTYTYDAAGRPVFGEIYTPYNTINYGPSFTTRWLWNSLDEQTLDMVNVVNGTMSGSLATERAGVHNQYDMYGRKTVTRYDDFYEVGRGYDALDRLASVGDAQGRAGVQYNFTGSWSNEPGLGGPVTREYANDMLTTFSYDGSGNIKGVKDQAITRDAQGNTIAASDRADIRWSLGSADGVPRAAVGRFTPSNGAAWSATSVYQVDPGGRTTAENHNLAAVPQDFAPVTNADVEPFMRQGSSWRSYVLGGTGNWLTRTDPAGSFSPTYVSQDRPTTWRNVGDATAAALHYDETGSLYRKEDPNPPNPPSYPYGDDELIDHDIFGAPVVSKKRVPNNEGALDMRSVEYRQDAFGRVVYVNNVDDPLGPALYGYDGAQPAMRVFQWTGKREAFVAGPGRDTYLYRVTTDPDSTYYFHQDRDNNVYMTTYKVEAGKPNPANTPLGTWPLAFYGYTAFGEREIRNAQGQPLPGLPYPESFNRLGEFSGDMFGFHGLLHWNQLQAQTVHMRNRTYRADMGRFTSPDPIGPAGGLNPYAFAESAPLRFEDPFGLNPAPTGRPSGGTLDDWLQKNGRAMFDTLDAIFDYGDFGLGVGMKLYEWNLKQELAALAEVTVDQLEALPVTPKTMKLAEDVMLAKYLKNISTAGEEVLPMTSVRMFEGTVGRYGLAVVFTSVDVAQTAIAVHDQEYYKAGSSGFDAVLGVATIVAPEFGVPLSGLTIAKRNVEDFAQDTIKQYESDPYVTGYYNPQGWNFFAFGKVLQGLFGP
jgi:RHS repeat-associated protein